jgi:3-oxoacyl-[acyl-carrier-protein] synthase II
MTSRDCPPEEACCPFDARRDGFILSEGAGFVVVEDAEHAAERGATPLARLEGYAAHQNAYHFVASPPDAVGPSLAIAGALRDAGLAPEQVPYVNAHGTSTRDNDWCETLAVRTAFGDAADQVMMSSSKAVLGHTMGAAGAIEAIISMKVLEHQLVPPTINLQEADPNCDLDYVAGEARAVELDHVLSNSFGFGGHSSSLVVGRVA